MIFFLIGYNFDYDLISRVMNIYDSYIGFGFKQRQNLIFLLYLCQIFNDFSVLQLILPVNLTRCFI